MTGLSDGPKDDEKGRKYAKGNRGKGHKVLSEPTDPFVNGDDRSDFIDEVGSRDLQEGPENERVKWVGSDNPEYGKDWDEEELNRIAT